MQPLSLPTPLGQAKIYLYSQSVDMRSYAVTEIMLSPRHPPGVDWSLKAVRATRH
jgi:hypothetical protein